MNPSTAKQATGDHNCYVDSSTKTEIRGKIGISSIRISSGGTEPSIDTADGTVNTVNQNRKKHDGVDEEYTKWTAKNVRNGISERVLWLGTAVVLVGFVVAISVGLIWIA